MQTLPATKMACDVEVNKTADHLLILRVVFFGFSLEELDAGFAQSDRDLDIVLFECQFLRRGQKIVNHAKIT